LSCFDCPISFMDAIFEASPAACTISVLYFTSSMHFVLTKLSDTFPTIFKYSYSNTLRITVLTDIPCVCAPVCKVDLFVL
jgi:hypothetical protein